MDLSRLACENLPKALRLMREVDLLALKRFENAREGLIGLATAIADTLTKGKRVYLCGCGATGRLQERERARAARARGGEAHEPARLRGGAGGVQDVVDDGVAVEVVAVGSLTHGGGS